ncbi:MAG: tripartite tricarboxylate transporter substrate binding protein [Fidelibacterota bacterium]|nr:MAG: tripartite tricarboxylate transporter substrate binding protein [Candidatus Neomarinimicrobiota bacterium]
MKHNYLYFPSIVCTASLLLAGFAAVSAPEWPQKPITVYVGWTAGGSSDVTTRALVLEMEKKLGSKVLVTNIPGANGSIGATQVAKAPPDGYFWFGGAAVHGTWPVLGYSDVSWTDFYAFLDLVMPTTIYVLKNAPWNTLQELIADIKASPKGRFRYGHPGAGSNGEIFGGLLLETAGAAGKARSIPYNGGREAGRYLLSKEIDFASVTMGDLADWAAAGRIRPLVNLFLRETVFEGVRYPPITDVYPELAPYQAINPCYGVYVRRDTPAEIVTKIAEAFVYAIQQEAFLDIVIRERAGILMPRLGRASDEQMARIESARGWALFRLGVAPNDPSEFDVPELHEWSWPPHQRAAALRPWPEAVETIYDRLP